MSTLLLERNKSDTVLAPTPSPAPWPESIQLRAPSPQVYRGDLDKRAWILVQAEDSHTGVHSPVEFPDLYRMILDAGGRLLLSRRMDLASNSNTVDSPTICAPSRGTLGSVGLEDRLGDSCVQRIRTLLHCDEKDSPLWHRDTMGLFVRSPTGEFGIKQFQNCRVRFDQVLGRALDVCVDNDSELELEVGNVVPIGDRCALISDTVLSYNCNHPYALQVLKKELAQIGLTDLILCPPPLGAGHADYVAQGVNNSVIVPAGPNGGRLDYFAYICDQAAHLLRKQDIFVRRIPIQQIPAWHTEYCYDPSPCNFIQIRNSSGDLTVIVPWAATRLADPDSPGKVRWVPWESAAHRERLQAETSLALCDVGAKHVLFINFDPAWGGRLHCITCEVPAIGPLENC